MTTQTDTTSFADAAYEMAKRAEKHPAAVALGKLAKGKTSPKKSASSRINAAKASRAAVAKRAQIRLNSEIAALLTKGNQ